MEALAKKVDTFADASVKVVDSVNAAKDSILTTLNSSKPDLTSITNEVRTLIQSQEAKIDNKIRRSIIRPLRSKPKVLSYPLKRLSLKPWPT